MKLMLGGIRGTSPVAGEPFVEFGGDTTAVMVEGAAGTRVVIDMGTGLRLIDQLIRRDRSTRSLFILLTHYHLDHLMGIPSFSPMYSDEWSLQIVGPILEGFTVEEVMHRILARPFWPLQMNAMRARITFADLGMPDYEAMIVRDGLQIQWCAVHHPGGCVAYRIDEPTTGQSFVFATDIEWRESSRKEQDAFLRLCRQPTPVQTLLFDGQYDPENSARFRGWGHSTWQDAAEVARRANVRKLWVIHHSPQRNDDELRNAERDILKVLPTAQFARQGQVLEL